ncbi:hypothetical protein NFX37_18410 [Serratia marcescens]|nr:hypothetical protein NFX37_18410 [Serratia marcescens]
MAIQACYQIGRRLAREVTLSELGRFPTIRSLCRALPQQEQGAAPVSIRRCGSASIRSLLHSCSCGLSRI